MLATALMYTEADPGRYEVGRSDRIRIDRIRNTDPHRWLIGLKILMLIFLSTSLGWRAAESDRYSRQTRPRVHRRRKDTQVSIENDATDKLFARCTLCTMHSLALPSKLTEHITALSRIIRSKVDRIIKIVRRTFERLDRFAF